MEGSQFRWQRLISVSRDGELGGRGRRLDFRHGQSLL
jgi:hypothetical protein